MHAHAVIEAYHGCARSRSKLRTGIVIGNRRRNIDVGLLVLVGISLLLTIVAYHRFLEVHSFLWTSTTHDRNAHFALGTELALDLRHFDVVQFLRDFNGSRVWGPLHGTLIGLIQVVGGIDYRLAVLPSLLGWMGAAMFGFLAARRLVFAGRNVAGFAAAIFILASPAHQAFATDIMLESMGACLSLLVLYLYLLTVQAPSAGRARALGLALTALFIFKYNYWLLAAFAVFAAEMTRNPGKYYRTFRSLAGGGSVISWCSRQLRHPLSYLIALLSLLVIWVITTGGGKFQIAGQSVSVTSPHNLVHLLYVCVFVRGWQWWRNNGRHKIQHWGMNARQIVYWHCWPIAIWFLLPKRLSYFLWFLSPANGRAEDRDFLGGLPYYWQWLLRDYHFALWSLVLALALFGICVLTRKRLRPGAAVLLWFVLLSALLTAQHPNRKSRYLHSWVAGVWVVAGAGLANLLYSRRTPRTDQRLSPAAPWPVADSGERTAGSRRTWWAAATVAGLAAMHVPSIVAGGRAPDAGPRPLMPTVFQLTEGYLPHLENASRPVIMSNQPIHALVNWTYRSRYPRQQPPEIDIRNYGRDPSADNRAMFHRWLNTTRNDHVVYIHIPQGTHFHEFFDNPGHAELRQMLSRQTEFRLRHQWELPQLGATIYHWQRD